jgi:hypothetical protein
VSPPKLTPEEWLLALDPKRALTEIHERLRHERDEFLWRAIAHFDEVICNEARRAAPDGPALEKIKSLRVEYLLELGLPAETATRRLAG